MPLSTPDLSPSPGSGARLPPQQRKKHCFLIEQLGQWEATISQPMKSHYTSNFQFPLMDLLVTTVTQASVKEHSSPVSVDLQCLTTSPRVQFVAHFSGQISGYWLRTSSILINLWIPWDKTVPLLKSYFEEISKYKCKYIYSEIYVTSKCW